MVPNLHEIRGDHLYLKNTAKKWEMTVDLALELENLVDFLKKIFPKIGVQSVEIKEEVVPKLHQIIVMSTGIR